MEEEMHWEGMWGREEDEWGNNGKRRGGGEGEVMRRGIEQWQGGGD